MPQASDGETFPAVRIEAPPQAIKLRYRPDALAVQPEVEQVGTAWSLVGGVEEEASLELYLVVAHPTEEGFAARLQITIPMIADSGKLHIGTLTVAQA